MTRVHIALLTTAAVLGTIVGSVMPVHTTSRCQYFSDGREPRCFRSDDTGTESYRDGRNDPSDYDYRTQRRRMDYRRRYNEGRNHTEDMATGGTMMGNILVSPYVPGSVQDRGWQAERRRRGLCGTDHNCLHQQGD
jgi:hypothetical protein